jgi:hypothetical protein
MVGSKLREKLFISRLQKQGPERQMTVHGSSPDGVCCSSKTKNDKKTAPGIKLFVSASKSQKQVIDPNVSWVQDSAAMFFRDHKLVCDIQRYVSDDRPRGKVSSNTE